jgi:hypothetical protein
LRSLSAVLTRSAKRRRTFSGDGEGGSKQERTQSTCRNRATSPGQSPLEEDSNLEGTDQTTVAARTVESEGDKNNDWSLYEKRLLLDAIKQYGSSDLKKLKTVVTSRSREEIAAFLQSLIIRTPIQPKVGGDWPTDFDVSPETIACKEDAVFRSLETWLMMCQKTLGERTDYSFVLSDVYTDIANAAENQVEAKCTVQDKQCTVNYARLYSYLACLLRGSSNPPALNPFESLVMLELTEELAERISTLSHCSERSEYLSTILAQFQAGKLSASEPHYAPFPMPPELLQQQKVDADASKEGAAASASGGDNDQRGEQKNIHHVDLTSLNPLSVPVHLLKLPLGGDIGPGNS